MNIQPLLEALDIQEDAPRALGPTNRFVMDDVLGHGTPLDHSSAP